MNRDELYELFSAYLSERATDEQIDTLNNVIRSDKEATKMLLEMSDTHMCLAFDESLWGDGLDHAEITKGTQPRHTRSRNAMRTTIAYAGWLSALVAIVVLCVQLQSTTDKTDGDNDRNSTQVAKHAAIVKHQIDAAWSAGSRAFKPGEPLDGQLLSLDAGIVQIEFGSNAQLALQGPAELRIDSEMECFLRHGKVSVMAPPEATQFTVKSPAGTVVDLGTEFGVVVDEDGQMDVHVLEGEVEVGTTDSSESAQRKRLGEDKAVTIAPASRSIEDTDIDRDAFEPIRYATLLARRPLKLQFDCGNRAGLYEGAESPAHSAGEMFAHEVFWNAVVGDQSGSWTLADGTVCPTLIEVDYGSTRKQVVDWSARPKPVYSTLCKTNGVFDNALGRDRLRDAGTVGLRIRGLPPGTYRVFFIGRLVDVETQRGDFLTNKAFRSAIGVNLARIPESPEHVMPLDDAAAAQWVEGQTHHVGEVVISQPDDYLTVLTRKSRQHSPEPEAGLSAIVGLQIIQLP